MKEGTKLTLTSVIITVLINASFYMIIKKDMNNYENVINEKTKIISQLEKDNIKNKELINKVRKTSAINIFSAFIGNDGIVTNEVTVKKAFFNEETWVIDIKPQPQSILKFKGDGNFTVPDREVKKMLLGIVDVFKKTFYEFFDKEFLKDTGIKDIKEIDILITNNNYDVGTYKNGKITLKGEK